MSKQKPNKKLPIGPKGKTEDDGSDVQDKDIAKKLLETIDLAEQRPDKERAKIYGDLYPVISRSPKLKDAIMTVVLKTRWKYEKHHKKLSIINRGRKSLLKHITNSLTKNQQVKLRKHRFDLFTDLYKPSDLTSPETFGVAVLEDNGLDREHHLGVVHDMTESSDLILPTTIFTSKFGSYRNGTFMGLRYYKSMKDCLQAEIAHAIGYEIDAQQSYNDINEQFDAGRNVEPIDYAIFDKVLFDASCILEIWRGKKISLECCSAALEIFSAFDSIDFFSICNLGSYLKKATKLDGWCSPLDHLATRDFEFVFGIPLSDFDWTDTAQIEWLKKNLKESYDGI